MYNTLRTRLSAGTVTALVLLMLAITFSVAAQGIDEQSAASGYELSAKTVPDGPSVVASTSWVGAIAEAAGARQVTVLAPIELRHPPEYDFKPSDVIAATEADLVLWAGYEGFITSLVAAAEIPEDRVVLVSTNNAPPQLRESVRALAGTFKTMDEIAAWERELDSLEESMLDGAGQSDTRSIRVAVHYHQQAFVRYLGYDVVAIFGPQDLTMSDLQAIENLDPDLVIDNWHSAQGEPLCAEGRSYVQLVNFPGPFGTESILDVLRYNASQLGLLP